MGYREGCNHAVHARGMRTVPGAFLEYRGILRSNRIPTCSMRGLWGFLPVAPGLTSCHGGPCTHATGGGGLVVLRGGGRGAHSTASLMRGLGCLGSHLPVYRALMVKEGRGLTLGGSPHPMGDLLSRGEPAFQRETCFPGFQGKGEGRAAGNSR